MWLVVGLGNPGRKYAKTRHNLGYMVVDAIASKFSISLKGKAKNFVYGRGIIEEKDVFIIKPLTFMNMGGIAVKEALKKYPAVEKIIVIHDDIDLATGVIRIKKTGSSGGHRGIESIIESLGTKDFIRLKIGIGRSKRIPPDEYVLKPFYKKEIELVEEAVRNASEAVSVILNKGIGFAQNKFHRD
jgi:PTH1 family peptidyl-tRNA hydrolase